MRFCIISMNEIERNIDIISIPKTICFRVTRKCNINCSFCQAPPNYVEEMSLQEVKKCIDKFAEAGMKSIKFTGGEPFIRKDIDEILIYSCEKGIQPVVCTNGILVNDKMINLLVKYKVKVKVSLHGMPIYHNKLSSTNWGEKIMNNIVRMAREGIFVSLHTIVTQDNKRALDELLEFCVENDINKISFICLIERGRAKDGSSKVGVPLNEIKIIVDNLKLKYKQLDLRVLDFSKEYYVLENDKRLCIEVDDEREDVVLTHDIFDNSKKLVCEL